MTKEDILYEIKVITQTIKDDPEEAHALEAALLTNFIKHIAKRKDKLGEKAQLVLTVTSINPYKWYA